MSKKRHIVNVNILVMNAENGEELAKYLKEHSEKIARVSLEDVLREEAEEAVPAAAPQEEEENDWDTECEDLVLEGELALRQMNEAREQAVEKEAAAAKAAVEAEQAEKEAEEA